MRREVLENSSKELCTVGLYCLSMFTLSVQPVLFWFPLVPALKNASVSTVSLAPSLKMRTYQRVRWFPREKF